MLFRSLCGHDFHIGVGSDVVCSTTIGNARASTRGMDNRTIPRFFLCLLVANLMQNIENDMNALINAHTHRGRSRSPYVGLTSNVLPEAQRSHTGVSSDYIQKANHEWFVLRVTYNRTQKAYGIISASDVQSYMPMHYVIKKDIGKKKRILQPLLPNLLFVYATREAVNSIIKKKGDETPVLKFYLDKTKPLEENGKHPPLTIPFAAMINFIKAISTDNEHVRIVSPEQCHYKSGDIVKVIDGEFEGVTGKVARIAGQQRVVVENFRSMFGGNCLYPIDVYRAYRRIIM